MTALSRHVKARKSLGQHFLTDSRIASRMVEAAELSHDDTVIEIGPGRGFLTRRLVRHSGHVVAIELDRQLYEGLPSRLDHPENLHCELADAREIDLPALAGNHPRATGLRYKVLGNLPYYAANPIIRLTLESEPPPSLALFMVQKEVAEGMTAAPGRMTLLSVATQFYADARVVCFVPPTAFRPAPKVRSAVVKLEVRDRPAVDVADRQAFFNVVRAGFSSPRKQLRNSLSHGLQIETAVGSAVLESVGIDGRRRPATLDIEEWGLVCASWQRMLSSMGSAP